MAWKKEEYKISVLMPQKLIPYHSIEINKKGTKRYKFSTSKINRGVTMVEKNKEDNHKLVNALLRYATETPDPTIRVGKQVFRISDIFNKVCNDRSFAEELVQYPEILNLEFSGEGYLGEAIAAYHPDLALEKIIGNSELMEKLSYPLPAIVVVAVVEEYAKTIIEKYPELLDLVDPDPELYYTVGVTIWILYRNLRDLLEEHDINPVPMRKS